MIWLQGGPYYELSFLVNNSENKEKFVRTILNCLKEKSSIETVNTNKELENKIEEYATGEINQSNVLRNMDINLRIQISGSRKSRLNIKELSDELVKVNFWFYGSIYDVEEWNQKGIQEKDKSAFKKFFKTVEKKLNPILGTIAYEQDCEELFLTEILSPNKYFTIKNLSIENIKERVQQNINEFEYCWINGKNFNQKQNIEIELKQHRT